MRRPEPTRRNLLIGAGALASLILLVAILASLTHVEPTLAPAALRPTTAASETGASEPDGTATTAAPTDDSETAAAALSPLPAKTSTVATVVATEGEIEAHAGPDSDEVTHRVPVRGDYGQPQVFLVLATDAATGRHEVLLPIRPNGSKGWIDGDEVTTATHDFQIQVSLSGFQMMVQRGDEVVIDTTVGIGSSDTPTVGGQYYTWVLIDPTNAGYGSFAYGLSGFSTLESFNGGDGRLGIHGDTNPSSFGRQVSHGCVRVPDETIVEMVETVGLPLGVPVSIVA